MADGKIRIRVNTEDKELDKLDRKLEQVDHKAEKLGNSRGPSKFTASVKSMAIGGTIANLLTSAFSKITEKVSELGQQAITSSDKFTIFRNQMSYLGKGTDEINNLAQGMKNFSSQMGVDINELIDTTSDLASLGVANFEEVAQGSMVLGKAFKLNETQMNSMNMVLRQTNGLGKLTRENYMQLAEASGVSANQLKKSFEAMGISSEEFEAKLTDGSITAEQVNEVFRSFGKDNGLLKLASDTSTVSGALGLLKVKTNEAFLEVFNLFNGDTTTGESSALAIGINKSTELLDRFTVKLREKKGELQGLMTGLQTIVSQGLEMISNYFGGFDFTGLLSGVTLAFQGLGIAVSEVFSGIGTHFVTFLTLVQNVTNMLMPTLQPIGAMFSSVFGLIAQAINMTIEVVLAFGNALLSSIDWGTITSFVTDLANTFRIFFEYLTVGYQMVEPYLIQLATWLGGTLGGAVNIAVSVLMGLWNTVLKPIAMWVFSNIPKLIQSTIQLVTSVVTWFTNMKNKVTVNWNLLKNVCVGVWNAMKQIISEKVQAIKDKVMSIFLAVAQFCANIWNKIKFYVIRPVMEAKDQAVQTFQSLKDGATQKLQALCDWVSGVMSSFGNFFRVNLWGHGSSIMQGFYNGLVSVWGKIQSFVSGIASWISSHKGPITYDRKLLVKNGQAIMEGLSKGLSSGFGGVKRQVQGMAPELQRSFNGAMSTGLTTNFEGAYNSSVASSLLQKVYVVNEVHTIVDLDGKVVGQSVAKYVTKEQERTQRAQRRTQGYK